MDGSRSFSSTDYTGVCIRYGQSNSQHITIYTDGASKYSASNKYNRSFSGWGYCFVNGKVHPSRNGSFNTPYRTGHGGLNYSTALEAELTALGHALDHCKSNTTLHIYTDCKALINLVSQPAIPIQRTKKLEVKMVKKISPLTPKEYNWLIEGRLISTIHNKIRRLKGCTLYINWIKGHQDLNDIDHSNINHIQGNNVADHLANKGVRMGIEAYLSRINKDKVRPPHKRRISNRQLKTKSRIFKHSKFCSLIAVRFLALKNGINPLEWKSIIGSQNLKWVIHAKSLVSQRRWTELESRYPDPMSKSSSSLSELIAYSNTNKDWNNRPVRADRVS